MAFTPCTTGTVALYRQGEDTVLALAVEAWDDAGVPYVAADTGLVRAGSLPGFLRLEQTVAELPRPDRQVRRPDRAGPRLRPGDGPRERGRP